MINIETLCSDMGRHVQLYFSGKKGFHIGIPAPLIGLEPSSDFPSICRELAVRLARDTGIDLSIYSHNRLLRIQNTLHTGSGLFKVRLTYEELAEFSVEGIRELAITPRGVSIAAPAVRHVSEPARRAPIREARRPIP